MLCVVGAPGLCRAALWFSAVSAVLAASLFLLALSFPTDRCRAQILGQDHAVGARRQPAAESDEGLVRDFMFVVLHQCDEKVLLLSLKLKCLSYKIQTNVMA